MEVFAIVIITVVALLLLLGVLGGLLYYFLRVLSKNKEPTEQHLIHQVEYEKQANQFAEEGGLPNQIRRSKNEVEKSRDGKKGITITADSSHNV